MIWKTPPTGEPDSMAAPAASSIRLEPHNSIVEIASIHATLEASRAGQGQQSLMVLEEC